MKNREKRRRQVKRVTVLVIIGILVAASYFAYSAYRKFFFPNITAKRQAPSIIIIPRHSNLDSVVHILVRDSVIIDSESFVEVAQWMKYERNIHPGRYFIAPESNNMEIVSLLRAGLQSPLKLVINNVRTKEELVSLVCSKLESDSAVMLAMLNDKEFLQKYGLTPENVTGIFIPNTYEFYWTTDAQELFARMLREFKKFWTPARLAKAKQLNLTPFEVIILASIVEQETIKKEEKKTIAGIYINRLKKGWRLQADPTVKFAIRRFELQRVLTEHTQFDSPYNTYLYDGLPPGPICLPERTTIDAVLNYEQHNYMYFCARDDFSGYHNFAVTMNEHIANARKFRYKLDTNKIF